MVSKKQKVRAMVMDDEEQAELIIKEAREKKENDLWKRIAHAFKIHTYNQRIKKSDDGELEVWKCKYCGQLHLVHELSWPRILIFGIVGVASVVLTGKGMMSLIRLEPLIPWTALYLYIGITLLFSTVRKILQKVWMKRE